MQKTKKKIPTKKVYRSKLIIGLTLSFLLAAILPVNIGAQPQVEKNQVPSKTFPPQGAEVLWDTWGVPHIFAPNERELFYAFGWCQMASHSDLILKLYGEARGRAAEYWGSNYYEQDVLLHTLDIPGRARRWYQSQGAVFRVYMDAFIAGMNDYAQAYPNQISPDVKEILPVKGEDILAHMQRIIHLSFIARDLDNYGKEGLIPGSNGWAIAPQRTAQGHTMLLANPHLPWYDIFLWYEAQMTAPGVDAYGVALIGTPILTIAFNDNLGWTHTVNTLDGMDLYQLKLAPEGYWFDGQIKTFTNRKCLIKVRQPDGKLLEKSLIVRSSIHGPVVVESEKATLALRMVGLDTPHTWAQYWDMMRAANLEQFETALKQMQQPFFNIIYADKDGHIMYLFNGRVPKRRQGNWTYWQGVIPGDTSATLWDACHTYEELPRVVDPKCGWVQNANDPPWSSTFPQELKPGNYPPYFSPRLLSLRAQVSIAMLQADSDMTLDEMITYKHSTRMGLADRILDELIAAARKHGDPQAQQAADLLASWDGCAEVGSGGAALFALWAQKMGPGMFAVPWQEENPLSTPKTLANPTTAAAALSQAAKELVSLYGKMDIPWGEINRLKIGNVNLPGNGGPGSLGIFRVVSYYPKADHTATAFFGDTFVAAVEFSTPVKAQVLLSYGNASQPHSSHKGDQLRLFSQKQLRPAWRTKKEILQHLEKKELLNEKRVN